MQQPVLHNRHAMKPFRSLHTKILFGYSLVGALFVALVVSALVQFRMLKEELAKHRAVVVFYDELRDARRLEKNYLLYEKRVDINEAVERAGAALEAIGRIRDFPDDERLAMADYRNRLLELRRSPLDANLPDKLLDETYASGSKALRLAEKLADEAQRRVDKALASHDANLLLTIWVSLGLGLIVGVLVTRSVVRPLRDIEASLHRVARGEAGRVDGSDTGIEVESLARSINDTLRELEARQKNLARSSRLVALGTMLSGVAHELNNPLSNISSSCQILQEEWPDLPAGQTRQLLGQIDDQVLRSQRIVSSLLDFSGTSPLDPRRESLRPLVEESLALLRPRMPQAIRVSLEIAPGLAIDVDRLRFQQVLINVVSNAFDAVGEQGNLTIRAWREDFPEGAGTTLEIEDDGAGIPAEALPRVFDPFFTTKPAGQGTGLGLFIAHEIVTQHGGTISAEAVAAGGTRLWMHIPDAAHPEDEIHG